MATSEFLSKSYAELLFKELDVIQDVIKNLDDIIYKTKYFAFLIWSGSLYQITQHLNIAKNFDKGTLILFTGIISLLFLAMDYKWRKHILQSSMRMKIISLYINRPVFIKLIKGETEDTGKENIPFYDPVGWMYTKDAFLFYGTMLLLSLILGVILITY